MSENLIPSNVLDSLPSVVRHALLKLSDTDQMSFVEEYKRKRKSIAVGYVMWILFSAHNVYLDRGIGMWLLQVIACACVVGIPWVLYDLFVIPSKIRELNNDIAKEILRDIKIMQVGNVYS